MKSKLIFFVRLMVLVVLYFICFAAVSSAVFQLPAEQPTPAEGSPALALFVVSFLNTVLLTYVIVRSRWAGWKLIGAIFLIFFGISTFMSQIETAYFLTRLPPGMLPRLFLSGAITAALFSPLAVLVLGKRRHEGPDQEGSSLLNMPLREWGWKLPLIAIAYLVIYFTFGYFIAWRSAAVRAYYGGSDPGSFLTQMGLVLWDTPGLVLLQVVRSILWTALAVLVIRMTKGRWWEIGLVVGLLFAVTNAQLLIPNPFMPAEVRMVHLLETATSNFLFGWLLVWVLCRLNMKQKTTVLKSINVIGLRFLLASGVAVAALAASMSTQRAQERPVYLDPGKPLEARVDDLLSRLTLEEKLALVHGDSKFTTAAIPRLGIPRRWLSDGPHGVREDVGPDTWLPAGRTDDFASSMPALIGLSSSFNPALSRAYGDVIGEEALKRDKQVMLGPGVNIMRTPLNGRNFEYWGEDPFLTSRMAVSYIRGVQSHEVAACVKHLAANNQEWERGTINVEMDERALREIYLPAFKAAVQEAEVWAVMGAYNKFRGEHACHNDYLLNKILKDEWGFKGLVMSDWSGTHDTKEAVMNGLDLEMGTEKPYDDFYLAGPFREGLRKGEFPMSVLDDKVRRNLRQMIGIGALNGRGPGAINTRAHQETARRVAEEAMVLLKNEGNALPLDDGKIKSVAVIGENAVQLQAYGGGSARIKTFYEITPLEGIVRRAGQRVNVTYSTGYRSEPDSDLVGRAVRAASQADVAIIVGGLNHSKYFDAEASDRKDMKLPYGQDELIQRVVAANPRTIVVFLGGGPVEMGPWLAKVPAVMLTWYPGMEGGNALARVLFGDVNPSGKLPCTFPKRLEDSPAHALGAYPGKNGQEVYAEGLLVGYRWFDTKKIEPLFPFGFGLSYTSFKYSSLKLTEGRDPKGPVAIAEFEIENAGTREGGEVAQLYVNQAQPRLPRPVKELKGFHKVFLKPGEKQKVSIPLEPSAFAYYDPDKKGWLAEMGEFTVLIGSSSRDIRLESKFHLSQTSFEK